MNIILTSILIIGFSLLPAQVKAASDIYYVTQNGNGANSGSSLSNAWSVSDFNSSANWSTTDHPNRIDPGDTVYFSGTITSQVKPPQGYGGSSGNYVTLDGWEGGTCDPVANLGCASAAVIDRPSRSSGTTNYALHSKDNSYLIIQDFNMQDSRGGIIASGPSSGSRSSHLIVRRNYIHDMSGKGSQITSSSSQNCIGIDYVTFGGADGDGNYVYDTIEDAVTGFVDSHAVGFSCGDDLVVSYNFISNNPALQDMSDGCTIVSVHTGNRALIEYNTLSYPHGQAVLSLKEQNGQDKIVRFNKIIGAGDIGGISISGKASQPNKNIYVYGNLVFSSATGIRTYKDYDEVHIWSNIIHNIEPESGSTTAYGYYTIPKDDSTAGNVYFYNNTLSRCDLDGSSSSKDSGFRVDADKGYGVKVKNNIFYHNVANDNDRQVSIASGSESSILDLDSNTYYSGGDTPYIYWNGANRTLAWMIANTDRFDNKNKTVDPGFTDPNGVDDIHGTADDDYTLDGTTIDDGEDLSECFDVYVQGENYHMCYDDALDPSATNWSTNPPTVGTTKQEDHGTWDRGAYVYSGPDSPLAKPKNLKIKSSS